MVVHLVWVPLIRLDRFVCEANSRLDGAEGYPHPHRGIQHRHLDWKSPWPRRDRNGCSLRPFVRLQNPMNLRKLRRFLKGSGCQKGPVEASTYFCNSYRVDEFVVKMLKHIDSADVLIGTWRRLRALDSVSKTGWIAPPLLLFWTVHAIEESFSCCTDRNLQSGLAIRDLSLLKYWNDERDDVKFIVQFVQFLPSCLFKAESSHLVQGCIYLPSLQEVSSFQMWMRFGWPHPVFDQWWLQCWTEMATKRWPFPRLLTHVRFSTIARPWQLVRDMRNSLYVTERESAFPDKAVAPHVLRDFVRRAKEIDFKSPEAKVAVFYWLSKCSQGTAGSECEELENLLLQFTRDVRKEALSLDVWCMMYGFWQIDTSLIFLSETCTSPESRSMSILWFANLRQSIPIYI